MFDIDRLPSVWTVRGPGGPDDDTGAAEVV